MLFGPFVGKRGRLEKKSLSQPLVLFTNEAETSAMVILEKILSDCGMVQPKLSDIGGTILQPGKAEMQPKTLEC